MQSESAENRSPRAGRADAQSAPALGGDPPGATPLDADDLAGLIPTWVADRADLDRAERDNILTAMAWARLPRREWTVERILSRPALAGLHRRMFADVWRWAGTWRRRTTNLGVSPHRIVTELEHLIGDVSAQTADATRLPWPADEIAVRFHHRLVCVHPFPNGNGRHARLAADILAQALGRPPFDWGGGPDLSTAGERRTSYLAALRAADRDFDYAPLIGFARVIAS